MTTQSDISLGFSPCPNDTFLFYGLVHNKVDDRGVTFEPPLLEDVEQLNLWALQSRLDVTKLSFHALGHVLDQYCILSSGSALGRGCGPLLVASGGHELTGLRSRKIAIPGKYTTAALLLRMFLPFECELVEMRFDLIMDAVQKGRVDAGVVIHESRFTYQSMGLTCLQDLGEWWEQNSSMPIPLGCIAAKRSLGREKISAIERVIADSVAYGFDNPDDCLPYIQANSQELAPEVVRSHIELYVNDYSRELGEEGMSAVELFMEKGRQAGALPASAMGLTF